MTSDSPLISSPPEQSLPPVRIHHFMLWSIVSAVMLTLLKTADDQGVGTSLMMGGNIPYLLNQSLALCGLGMGLHWRRRGLRFFHQPGHAAFISYGIASIFLVAWTLLWKFSGSSAMYGAGYSWLGMFLVYGWYAQLLLQAGLSLFFAYQFRAFRRWQCFFLVQALATLMQIVGYLGVNNLLVGVLRTVSADDLYRSYLIQASIPLVVETITSLCLAIVVFRDYRQRVSYHWTHWLGVFIWFVMWFAMFAALIWTLLLAPEWLTVQGD